MRVKMEEKKLKKQQEEKIKEIGEIEQVELAKQTYQVIQNKLDELVETLKAESKTEQNKKLLQQYEKLQTAFTQQASDLTQQLQKQTTDGQVMLKNTLEGLADTLENVKNSLTQNNNKTIDKIEKLQLATIKSLEVIVNQLELNSNRVTPVVLVDKNKIDGRRNAIPKEDLYNAIASFVGGSGGGSITIPTQTRTSDIQRLSGTYTVNANYKEILFTAISNDCTIDTGMGGQPVPANFNWNITSDRHQQYGNNVTFNGTDYVLTVVT
jgi:hypothetical protein